MPERITIKFAVVLSLILLVLPGFQAAITEDLAIPSCYNYPGANHFQFDTCEDINDHLCAAMVDTVEFTTIKIFPQIV